MKNMVSEAAPATPEQQQHVTEMITAPVAQMVEKYLDSHDGGVRFVDQGTEVTNDVRDFVRDLVRKYGTPNLYANEEVVSNYAYPVEFKGPKPLVEQINTHATMFGLDPASALAYAQNLPDLKSFVPEDALPFVDWFAFPRSISRELILTNIADSRQFYNYRAKQMDRFRVHTRTAAAIEELAEMQGNGGILVVAAQLGMLHRGRSTRRARERFVRNEFGLDTLIGGSIALTHPERFVRWEELDMDLPGDEFDDPGSDVRFDRAACLVFSDGRLGFGTGQCGATHGRFGSASGFRPPQK